MNSLEKNSKILALQKLKIWALRNLQPIVSVSCLIFT